MTEELISKREKQKRYKKIVQERFKPDERLEVWNYLTNLKTNKI